MILNSQNSYLYLNIDITLQKNIDYYTQEVIFTHQTILHLKRMHTRVKESINY